MRSKCIQPSFWKLLLLFLALLVVSQAGKNDKNGKQTKNNFKNYGKYGSGKSDENVCTCETSKNNKNEKPDQLQIRSINLCGNLNTPDDWEKDKEVFVSIEGGANICMKVDGINSSIVNEVKAILFKDKTSLEILHAKVLDNDDIILTGSSKQKLQFVLPSLTTVRETDFHSKRTWKFEYLVEVQLNDDSEVACQFEKKCMITYSYGYTPVIDYLSNTAAIAHQDVEFRITRQRALDIKKDKMALKKIRIEDGSAQHSCDYNTKDKINKDSDVSMYGARQYSCNLDAIDFVADGKFKYEDYAGKGLISDFAETYDVDGSKFQIRVLPSIDEVSIRKALKGGGQRLKIKGNAFMPGRTKFFIDGVECPILEEPKEIKNKKQQEAICEMPEMLDDEEERAFYVGNHGWQQSVYMNDNRIDKVMNQPKMIQPNRKILVLNADNPFGNLEFKNQKAVSKFDALFKVPKTAKYKFFMTASREGRLYMNPTKPNEIFKRQEDLQLLLKNEEPHSLRNLYDLYDDKTGKFKMTEEFLMTEGDFYQMQMWHFNGEENQHLTLGVEIENDTPMPNSRYEVQRIRYMVPAWNPSFYFKLTWENFSKQHRFNIAFDYYTADSGSTPYNVDDIKVSLDVWKLKAKLKGYFKKQFGEDIEFKVEKNLVMNDEEQYLEIIIGFPSGTQGLPMLQPSVSRPGGADVSKCIHKYHRGSGGFQNKKWKLEVYNPVAQTNVLIDNIPQDVPDWRLLDRITADIPLYHRKMQVERRQVINNGAIVGYEWILSFPGLREDIPQFNAINIDIPDAEFKSETIQPYSTNIFLFPAPYSLFYQIHDQPQITVTVDDRLGACNWSKNHKDSCSIEMEKTNAKIKSFECKAPYTKLVIRGEELDTMNYEKIEWAGQRCEGIRVKKDKITCEIRDPKPGKHKPKVFVKGKGSLKVPKGSDIHIPADMEFTPSKTFTTGGGNLIMTLKQLPPCTCKVKIYIGDKECKKLRRVRKSNNKLKCKIPKLKEEGDLDVKLEIDGKITLAPQKIKVKKLKANASVDKKSRKGSQKGVMQIKCGGIEEDLSLKSLKKFFVYLYNIKTNRRVRMRTNRCSYNKQTKENTLDVYFPGCSRGKYKLIVEHEEYGQINEEEEEIDVGPEIKTVGPLQGSLEGGTLVTITGTNFEEGNTIYFNRQECKIVDQQDEKIECLSPATPKRDSRGNKKNAQATIFMKDSDGEIVRCPDDIECTYRWKFDMTPEIIATSMDNGVFTCMGRGFPADMNEIEVKVGGRKQKMQRVHNKNQFSCKISDLESAEEEMEVEVRTREGRCRMKNSVRKLRAPKPRFNGISNKKASKNGCKMKIKGEYFAEDSELELINDTGRVICDKMKFLNFNEMECETKKGQYNPRKCRLRKKNRKPGENGDVICDGENCDFETSDDETPVVSKCEAAGKEGRKRKFKISGKRFKKSKGGCKVRIGKVQATKVVVINENEIEVEFEDGCGFPQGVKPVVEFESGDVSEVEKDAEVTIPVENPTAVNGQFSSVRGGADLEYKGSGLGADKNMEVEVCGFKCPRNAAKENDDKIVCTLPPIFSAHTVQRHPESVASTNLKNLPSTSLYTPNTELAQKAFDGNTATSYGTTELCYVGLKISTFQRMTIDELRYYLSPNAIKEQYIGGKFKASLDGVNWTILHEITELPMDGWNTIDKNCGSFDFSMYRFVQFSPSPKFLKACDFAELLIKGKEMFVEQREEFPCNAVLYQNDGTKRSLVHKKEAAVKYSYLKTPKITGVNKRYISWRGGDQLVINGEGFSTTPSDVTVTIDGVECRVIASTVNEITCTTGERKELVSPSTLDVLIKGRGFAENQGHITKYVCYFSDDGCWGNDYAPGPGDSLYIPKGFNLVIDVDEVPNMDDAEPEDLPYLQAVVVEGSLIFETKEGHDDHERKFSAGYIIAREGTIEIGTAQNPYKSNLEIILYGAKQDPQLPLFGNKVIGVWEGKLDIHGRKRPHTWLELAKTADKGASEITINKKKSETDWKIGDEIVIASTSFEYTEAQQFTIKDVKQTSDDSELLVVQLSGALEYTHYAGSKDYGETGKPEMLTMRAEVGLLTRSVKIRGDDSTTSTKYGGHIMLKGDNVIGRISHVELKNMGQAYQLQRHPVTFTESEHLGESYVSHSAIWDGYNRAIAIHASNCLKIEGNVAYNVMGHNYFLQDGIETKNSFIRNLAISTVPSHSLLNTDQTPASFWITNPNNYFEGNHAAGSDMYGFWFNLPKNPTGSSETQDICPEGVRLGKFEKNVAHTNGRYGLRVFPKHIPRTYPCVDAMVEPAQGSTNPESDAYDKNPAIPAEYKNFLGFKNKRSAIITEEIGALQFKGIQTADNLEEGIEISLPGYAKLGQGFVDGALIVGFTENNGEDMSEYKETKGITTGQRDSFRYSNIRFIDFKIEGNTNIAAIGTCSHCSLSLDEDGFVNTHLIEKVTFKNVTSKILYHKLKRTVIHNPDGSIVGKEGNFYLASYLAHLQDKQKSCELDDSLDKSVVCTKPIRKLIFKNMQPTTEISGQEIKIIRMSDMPSPGAAWTEQTTAKMTVLLPNLKLAGQWEVPFLMGEEYHVHWLEELDWTEMSMKRSRHYKVEDGYYSLFFNYTDRRDIFTMKSRAQISNVTAPGTTKSTQRFGMHHNHLAKKEYEVLVNANPFDAGLTVDSTISVTTTRCADGCAPEEGLGALEQRVRYWSVASDWAVPEQGIEGHVPKEGETPHIRRGWNMYYDILPAQAVDLKSLVIQGRLTFNDTLIDGIPRTYELRSHIIAIELGELLIGTAEKPYENKAIITLLGSQDSPVYSYSNSVTAGNKIIFVTGNFVAYGKDLLDGGKYTTKLQAPCKPEDTKISLEPGLKWKPNMEIVLAPSGFNEMHHEEFKIVSYNDATGETELNKAIKHDHYGSSYDEQEGTYSYDMRAEVGLLTRNIVIRGDKENETWGGQIFVTEWTNPVTETTFAGRLVFRYVELMRMSQHDTMHAAIRLRSLRTKIGSISNSAIHHSRGIALFVLDAHSITFNNNVIYKTLRNAVVIRIANDFEMMNNLIISNEARKWNPEVQLRDFQVAVDVCTGEMKTTCKNIKIQKNIVAGGKGIAFAAPSADCTSVETETKTKNLFKDNRAHSVYAGLISHINNAITGPYCGLVQDFTVHHASEVGVQSLYHFTKIVARNLIIVDCKVGIELGLANGDNPNGDIHLSNSLISGAHAATKDCAHKVEGTGSDKIAMMTSPGFATTIETPFSYPTNSFHKFGLAAARGKMMTVEKVTFKNYNKRACDLGNIPRVVQLHQDSSDLVMKHVFKDITVDNVNEANMLYLADPNPDWANIKYCGEFVCTGPENILFEFQGTLTQKNNVAFTTPQTPFTVISNNKDVIDNTCTLTSNWNAYTCTSTNWGLLQFESLDPDNYDRALQPIWITSDDQAGYKNKLNAFMDRATGGFYIDQKRMSRFVSLIRTNLNGFFNVSYTGTPPQRQIFELHGASKSDYLKVRIDFTRPESVRVLKGGEKVAQNEIVEGKMKQLVGDVCGENRWDPVNAILEFTIQGGENECNLELKIQDSIQLGLRMDMDINKFYSSNAQMDFIDKIAMQLGIERDRIKIVAIREGSVVINFEIEPNPSMNDLESQEIELQILSTSIQDQVNNGTLDVGAPLLDFEINLKVHPTETSEPISTNRGHSGTSVTEAEKQSLVWPIAIMVLSVALIFGTVVLLIIFIKRRTKKVVVGENVNKDDPIFRKVAPHRMESIADSLASNVTSDRNLKVMPGQSLDFSAQLNKKL